MQNLSQTALIGLSIDIYSLICLFIFTVNFVSKRNKKSTFILFLIFSILNICLEILLYFSKIYFINFYILLMKLYELSFSFVIFYIDLYFIKKMFNENKSKSLNIIKYLFIFLIIIFSFLILFSNLQIENGGYGAGTSAECFILFLVISPLFLLISLIINIKTITKRKVIVVLFYLFTLFISMIINLTFSYILTSICLVFVNLCIYVLFENPDKYLVDDYNSKLFRKESIINNDISYCNNLSLDIKNDNYDILCSSKDIYIKNKNMDTFGIFLSSYKINNFISCFNFNNDIIKPIYKSFNFNIEFKTFFEDIFLICKKYNIAIDFNISNKVPESLLCDKELLFNLLTNLINCEIFTYGSNIINLSFDYENNTLIIKLSDNIDNINDLNNIFVNDDINENYDMIIANKILKCLNGNINIIYENNIKSINLFILCN